MRKVSANECFFVVISPSPSRSTRFSPRSPDRSEEEEAKIADTDDNGWRKMGGEARGSPRWHALGRDPRFFGYVFNCRRPVNEA